VTWGRNDPGWGPSPDPAAAAERYYAEQDRMNGPDPEDCGGDCGSCMRCREDERETERQCLVDEPAPSEFKKPLVEIDEEEVPF